MIVHNAFNFSGEVVRAYYEMKNRNFDFKSYKGKLPELAAAFKMQLIRDRSRDAVLHPESQGIWAQPEEADDSFQRYKDAQKKK